MASTDPGGVSWPVVPAQRVGPFVLGMGVNEAVAIIQKMGSLDRAELCLDEHRLFDIDVTLRLPTLGLQLCFDAFQQDLRMITVCLDEAGGSRSRKLEAIEPHRTEATELLGSTQSIQRLPLSYGGRLFTGRHEPQLQLRDIYAMFGPTWIGDFLTEGGAAYHLRYPGLTFEFPMPGALLESLAARGEHPFEMPGHMGNKRISSTASRLWVFAADSPSLTLPISVRACGLEKVVVRPATGVGLQNCVLRFGSLPEDVFSDFGPPEHVCVKDVDAVRIHSASSSSSLQEARAGTDYYYNYFHLGLDVLFDGRTHLVKKIILHTNPPMHEFFSRYTRCFFEIPVPSLQVRDSQVMGQTAQQGAFRDCEVEHNIVLLEENALPEPRILEPSVEPVVNHPAASEQMVTELVEQSQSTPSPPLSCSGVTPGVGDAATDAVCMLLEKQGTRANDDNASSNLHSNANGSAMETAEPEIQGDENGVVSPRFLIEGQACGRVSKRERKNAKKKRGKVLSDPSSSPNATPQVSPNSSPVLPGLVSQDGSPQESFQASAQGSPQTPASLVDGASATSGAPSPPGGSPVLVECGAEEEPACWDMDILPPPAVPLDSASGVDDAAAGSEVAMIAQGRHHFTPERTVASHVGDPEHYGAVVDRSLEACSPTACIDIRWQWRQIQEALGRSCGKPLVVSGGGSHMPFGSTYFYAYPGLVFEVMQNGYVASLTVFSVPREELLPVFSQCASVGAPLSFEQQQHQWQQVHEKQQLHQREASVAAGGASICEPSSVT